MANDISTCMMVLRLIGESIMIGCIALAMMSAAQAGRPQRSGVIVPPPPPPSDAQSASPR